ILMSSGRTRAVGQGLRDSRVSGEAALARCVATLLSRLLSTEQSDAGSSPLVVWPELDALSSCVKEQLGVDADPRFAAPERRPLADELQRPGWRQRPCPPPRELIVRGATAAAWSQDRFCRLGVTRWSSADDLAAIGELQTGLEGPASERSARRGCVGARGDWAGEGGDQQFEFVCGGRGWRCSGSRPARSVPSL